MTGRIGLAEAIEQLRRELGEAQQAAAAQQLRFEVAEVEMELLVELTKDGGPQARATFGVVRADADAKPGNAHTHRLKLRLKVTGAPLGARAADVTDRRRRIWDD